MSPTMVAAELPRSRNRPARSRREQALRAEARTISRILRGVAQLHAHRGSQPSRLGSALALALRTATARGGPRVDAPPPPHAETPAPPARPPASEAVDGPPATPPRRRSTGPWQRPPRATSWPAHLLLPAPPWRVHSPAPPPTDEVIEATAGPPTAPPLAASKQSRVLSCEVLTTDSATGLTATSIVLKESRVLFIEALSGPTTLTPAGLTASLASPSPSCLAAPEWLPETISGPITLGPAGFIASPASSPPSFPAIPKLVYHSEESAAGEDDGSVRDPLLRLDAIATMLETRILEQCEPIELAPGLLSGPSRPETATAFPRGEDSQGRLKHSERKRRKRAWNALLRAGLAAAADVSGVWTFSSISGSWYKRPVDVLFDTGTLCIPVCTGCILSLYWYTHLEEACAQLASIHFIYAIGILAFSQAPCKPHGSDRCMGGPDGFWSFGARTKS